MNCSDEAIASYDGALARLDGRPEPELAEPVTNALFNKGVTLGMQHEFEDEQYVAEGVVARFEGHEHPGVAAEQVAKARELLGLIESFANPPGEEGG